MDEIRAAIGLCQLGKIDRLNARRRRVYHWYIERLAAAPDFTVPFQHRDLESSACHIMPLIIRGDADAVRQRLTSVGVQTSMHYKPITSFPIYQGPVPAITNAIAPGLITVPLSAAMTEADVEFVTASLTSNHCAH
jgi:dTDP-4-amino-4,6-dideoxygalactose transaminase